MNGDVAILSMRFEYFDKDSSPEATFLKVSDA